MQTIRYGKARLARFHSVTVYTFEQSALLVRPTRRAGVTSTERRPARA
jgi:hypothetical protein